MHQKLAIVFPMSFSRPPKVLFSILGGSHRIPEFLIFLFAPPGTPAYKKAEDPIYVLEHGKKGSRKTRERSKC